MPHADMLDSRIVARSAPMRRLVSALAGVSERETPVLILGEKGSGRGLVARTIHAQSRRCAKPFVRIDCAKVTDLVTGGSGGTLFLDEVSALSACAQTQLLTWMKDVQVRILASSADDLTRAVAEGRFLAPLLARLDWEKLCVPPLRDRGDDLVSLIHTFVEELAPAGKKPVGLTPRALAALSLYGFPGNVRELRQAVELALLRVTDREIDTPDLPEEIA